MEPPVSLDGEDIRDEKVRQYNPLNTSILQIRKCWPLFIYLCRWRCSDQFGKWTLRMLFLVNSRTLLVKLTDIQNPWHQPILLLLCTLTMHGGMGYHFWSRQALGLWRIGTLNEFLKFDYHVLISPHCSNVLLWTYFFPISTNLKR